MDPAPFVVDDRAMPYAPGLLDPEFDSVGHQVLGVESDRVLWVASVDPATGDIDPPDGRGEWVDDQIATLSTGNGPEWLYTERGEEIVYAYRWNNTTRVVHVWRGSGGWDGTFLPNSDGLVGTVGSLDPDDPSPRIVSKQGDALRAWWRFLDDDEDHLVVDASMPYMPRWVPASHQAIFAARWATSSRPSCWMRTLTPSSS